MWKDSSHSLLRNPLVQLLLLFLIVLTVWWALLGPFNATPSNDHARFIWGATYQVIALLGGLFGIKSAYSWGGLRSVMGRSILSFSIGLLLQSFGQSVYSFYNLYLQVEAPYPSLGDVGFFGSIPFYIYGVLLLSRAAGARASLRVFTNRLQAIVLPIILLGVSYIVFLQDYEFEGTSMLQVLLDFGYPLGQAIYVSFAILSYLLSRKILGGIMRVPVFFVLISLVLQYLSDYNFLYQFSQEAWHVGGYGDYLYLFSYFLMSISLIQLGTAYQRARKTSA